MLPNVIVVIVLQYVSVSNQHMVHLKINTTLYVNSDSIRKRKQRTKGT